MRNIYVVLMFMAVVGYFIQAGKSAGNRFGVPGLDVGVYADTRNPLYRMGYFRKYSWQGSGKMILTGIRGLYICEVMTIAQITAIAIFGIYNYKYRNGFFDRRVLTILVIWIVLNGIAYSAFNYRYIDILKRELKDKKYYPFQYKKCVEIFEEVPSVYSCTQENIREMQSFFKQETYKGELSRSRVMSIDEKNRICFYYKEEKETVKIYGLICTDVLEKDKLADFDGIFQEFLKEYIVGNMFDEEWYLILVFIADHTSECLMDMVTKSIIQLEKRYRLPVAVSLEEKKVYIPNQKELYKKDKSQRMVKDIEEILKDGKE